MNDDMPTPQGELRDRLVEQLRSILRVGRWRVFSGDKKEGWIGNGVYRPDIVVWEDDRIHSFIEIEMEDGGGKGLVGACMLAHHYAGADRATDTPAFFVVVPDTIKDSEIRLHRQRLDIVAQYAKRLTINPVKKVTEFLQEWRDTQETRERRIAGENYP